MSRRFTFLGISLTYAIVCAFFMMSAAPSHAQDPRPHLEVTYDVTTLKLYPAADAFINEFQPDRNYGSSSALVTRNRYGSGGNPGWAWQDLIEFDLSPIPPSTTIDSATMRFYYHAWDDNNPAGRDLDVYRVTQSWNEETVTWSNQPTYDSSSAIATAQVPSSIDTWMEWNVTSAVQDIVEATVTNHGWLVLDPEPWNNSNIPIARFRATEFGGSYCGDGVVDPGEQCDDGNNDPGDGCGPTCLFEECGNGFVDPGEDCDDGNTIPCDGCSEICEAEVGYVCSDGILNPDCGEECDDNNNTSCDGCSSECVVEIGWVCGDGTLNPDCGEECDDGNNVDGDGCSADCAREVVIPAVSNRGAILLAVMLLVAATGVLAWRRRAV